MRVLFLGTTGLKKNSVLSKIADIALKEKFELKTGIKHQDANRHIQIFDVDERIKHNLGKGYSSFMDDHVREQQKELWIKEINKILKEIEQAKTEHVFLSIHGTYYRYNNFFSMFDMSILARFKPTIIITLIDDIYDVSQKVTEKEQEYKTNSSCTLSEALSWRTVEILMGDNLSEHLFINPETACLDEKDIDKVPDNLKWVFSEKIPHFVIAVKHNSRMLYQLLFQRKKLQLYASFPITSTRFEKAKIDEINNFKAKLEEKYTVFDPATIDEIIVLNKSKLVKENYEKIKSSEMFHKEQNDWILLKRLYGDYSRETTLPTFNPEEIGNIQDAILKQVEKRDYRMVEQTQGVVAYRPFWGGRPDPAGGVDAELRTAIKLHKGAFAFHPKEDGDPKLLFTGVEDAERHDDIEKLFAELEKWQQDNEEKMADKLDTWE